MSNGRQNRFRTHNFLYLIFHVILDESFQRFAQQIQEYGKTGHISIQIVIVQEFVDLIDVSLAWITANEFPTLISMYYDAPKW